jgi:hypothetical protein
MSTQISEISKKLQEQLDELSLLLPDFREQLNGDLYHLREKSNGFCNYITNNLHSLQKPVNSVQCNLKQVEKHYKN